MKTIKTQKLVQAQMEKQLKTVTISGDNFDKDLIGQTVELGYHPVSEYHHFPTASYVKLQNGKILHVSKWNSIQVQNISDYLEENTLKLR